MVEWEAELNVTRVSGVWVSRSMTSNCSVKPKMIMSAQPLALEMCAGALMGTNHSLAASLLGDREMCMVGLRYSSVAKFGAYNVSHSRDFFEPLGALATCLRPFQTSCLLVSDGSAIVLAAALVFGCVFPQSPGRWHSCARHHDF